MLLELLWKLLWTAKSGEAGSARMSSGQLDSEVNASLLHVTQSKDWQIDDCALQKVNEVAEPAVESPNGSCASKDTLWSGGCE